MDHRLRIATAAAILLAGLGLASFFRRPASEHDVPFAANSDPLVLRKQPDTTTTVPVEVAHSSPTAANPASSVLAEPRRTTAAALTPSDRPAAVPEFSRAFPVSGPPSASRWGVSLGEVLPEAAAATPATHKVSDGDSLALLAERYLGSAQRAAEIFEANRNVLTHPQILPIGVELKIPRMEQAAAGLRPLTPIDSRP